MLQNNYKILTDWLLLPMKILGGSLVLARTLIGWPALVPGKHKIFSKFSYFFLKKLRFYPIDLVLFSKS